MKEKTPTRELLRCTVQYYSPQHAQIGQFSTIVSMRGRFLFQRSAVPRTRAPSWGDISCTRTRLSTHRRRRGPGTPEPHTPPVWRAPEGQEGLAAAPVGGGGAWLRRPWAAAGSGRAHQNHRHRRCGGRRRARAGFEAGPGCGARGRRRGLAGHTRTTGTAGVEGAGGTGGHGRASRSTTPSRRLACGDLAGGRARRRPEHRRRRNQHRTSGGAAGITRPRGGQPRA